MESFAFYAAGTRKKCASIVCPMKESDVRKHALDYMVLHNIKSCDVYRYNPQNINPDSVAIIFYKNIKLEMLE